MFSYATAKGPYPTLVKLDADERYRRTHNLTEHDPGECKKCLAATQSHDPE